jgi:hypothetical protein
VLEVSRYTGIPSSLSLLRTLSAEDVDVELLITTNCGFISMSASRLMSIELVEPHAGLLLTDLGQFTLADRMPTILFSPPSAHIISVIPDSVLTIRFRGRGITTSPLASCTVMLVGAGVGEGLAADSLVGFEVGLFVGSLVALVVGWLVGLEVG